MNSFADTTWGCRSSEAEHMADTNEIAPPTGSALLTWLLDTLIVLPEEWEELPAQSARTSRRSGHATSYSRNWFSGTS